MARRLINFRISEDLISKLEELSKRTGKSKTAIVEEALISYLSRDSDEEKRTNETEKALEILEKQNNQLQQALKTFQIALESKEQVIKEKDERIKELKETIELLKHFKDKSKKWWQFWK